MLINSKRKSLEEIIRNRKKFKRNISRLKKEIREIKYNKDFELTGLLKQHYESWNKGVKEKEGNFYNVCKPYKDEKDCAIKWKKAEIEMYKNCLTALICEEKGHVEKIILSDKIEVYVNCERCGAAYTRPINSEKSKEFIEEIRKPITI